MTVPRCRTQDGGTNDARSTRCQRPATCDGFTYVALLAAIVIIGIVLSTAGNYWSSAMQREREEELLFRGDQYRRAIERYYTAIPGRPQLPPSIEELLKDSRSATGKRHLRQQYKDPMTGEDLELIRDQALGNRIIGVFSKSEKTPIKQAGFPDPYGEFQGKQSYAEWKFVFTPPSPAPGQPGTLPRPLAQPTPPAAETPR